MSLPAKTGPGQVMGTEVLIPALHSNHPRQPDGGAWGYRLPVPTPGGCSGLPTSCLGSVPLGQVPTVLGLLPRYPTDLTSACSKPVPPHLMDWQLFLVPPLGSFSAVRVACPKPTLIPVASFKKPPLNSCCKEPPILASLDSGDSGTSSAPLGSGDSFLVLGKYPSPGRCSLSILLADWSPSLGSLSPGVAGVAHMVVVCARMVVGRGYLSLSSQSEPT